MFLLRIRLGQTDNRTCGFFFHIEERIARFLLLFAVTCIRAHVRGYLNICFVGSCVSR